MLILLLSSLFGFASASDSHEYFEKAGTDLKALYASLNRTKEQMVDSLGSTLKVNLSVENNTKEGSRGSFNYTYNQDNLNKSFDLSKEIEENLLDAHDLLSKIKGEVSSYEYVRKNYQPFYLMSVNLTNFIKSHSYFIDNVSVVIDHFNNESMGPSSPDESFKGTESFNDASYNLERMNKYLQGMEESYSSLDTSVFDIELLKERITNCYRMINDYREILDDILDKYKDLPLSITLYVQEILHPGESYGLQGFLVKGGEYIENTTVELYIDEEKVDTLKTNERGHYQTEMKVPWDSKLGNKNFRVESPSRNVSSNIITVDVKKWPSDIYVDSDKDYYHNEIIDIKGSFYCKAPIDKSDIDLLTDFSDEIEVENNGSFRFKISSKNFEWGMHNFTLEYLGNETVSSSNDFLSFKRNIPTELNLKSKISGKHDLERPLPFTGNLINRSSKEGIGGFEVNILIDEKKVSGANTTANGSYNLSLHIDDLGLEKGNHRIKAVFEGSKKYRRSETNTIRLFIGEDSYIIDERDSDEDNIFGLFKFKELIVLIFVLSAGIFTLLIHLYIKRRNSEDVEKKEETIEGNLIDKKEEPVLTQVKNKEEVPYVYGHLINKLEKRGIVDVKKGTTHRDILKDLSRNIGLDKELKKITNIFEKAYFTQDSLSTSEIESFNSSLNKVEEEVLW